MRLSHLGLATLAIVSLAAAACDDRPNRTVNDPASNPTPQPAFNDPQVRQPNDPIANNHNPSQEPFPAANPQNPAIGSGDPQSPATDPSPQKPFYGPGLGPSNSDKSAAKTDKPLNDNEIVAVALAANAGEVQVAEVAKRKASSQEVKQFAAMMYTHHNQGVTKTKSLQSKAKLEGADSDLSQKLKSDVSTTLSSLRDKEGKDFDRAYMDSQVKAHKDVLSAMDDRLVPNAQHTELKTLLGDMRRQVADHLAKAEDIKQKLDKAPAASLPADNSTSKGKVEEPKRAAEPKTDKTDKTDTTKNKNNNRLP